MPASTSSDWVMSPDWVWSNNSNVSVAKDRGWFTSYTPFTTHTTSLLNLGSTNMPVTGIGSVSIPVKLCSRRKGKIHNTLVIDDVLHAPTALCNILGQGNFERRYIVDMQSGIRDRQGSKVATFDEKKIFKCPVLSGPPVGPSTTPSLFLKSQRESNRGYYINAIWPDSERARWEAVKPYTDAEKVWLKQHFEDEFHFLRQYGLSIHKDEDREEGKVVLRSLMANDSSDSSGLGVRYDASGGSREDEDDDTDDDANSFLDEIEADPISHMADYRFSYEQLDWIKKHYKHSANFLLSYGLKPYKEDDVDEGLSIVRAMMSDDD